MAQSMEQYHQQQQQQMDIEVGQNRLTNRGSGDHEVIPLQRLDSQAESRERQRLRRIFNTFDVDNNGYLSIHEMKNLIRAHQCEQLPKGIARKILDTSDEDQNGHLDFEEFYKMAQQHQWLFGEYVAKYCHMIVPSPRRQAITDEIDGQYERSMTFCPPPLTMVIFSIVEIITFLIDVVHLKDYRENDLSSVGLSTRGPAAQLFIYNPFQREQAWRFVTYMFVHVGVMHLMMNLLVQIFLGVALELVHCWWRVALVYVAGVLAGSMGTSITSPRIFLAGASGGVYALITAHIATIIMNWSEMEYAVVQFFVFFIFCATDVGMSIYRHITDANDQIGYMAHLCGAVAGLLVGIGVLRNLKVRPWEKKLWWFAVTIYFTLMFIGICIHIFYPSHFPQSKFT